MPGDIVAANSPSPAVSITRGGVGDSLANIETGSRGYALIKRLSIRAKVLAEAVKSDDLQAVALRNEVTRKRFALHDQLQSANFHYEHGKKAFERAKGPNGHIRRKIVKDANGKETTVEVNELEAQEAEIARLRADLRSLDSVKTESEVWPTLLDQAGRQNVNRDWRDLDLSRFEPKKNESEIDFYKRAYATVDELSAQEKIVFKSPRTTAELKASIVSDLDRLENDGRPRINGLRRGWHVKHSGKYSTADAPDAAIEWPETWTGAIKNHDAVTVDDAVPLMVWAFRDQIQKKLFDLAEGYGDAGTMTEADKNAALAKIRADLWMAKHCEEVAIRRCKAAGMAVQRREFDFRILLSIE